MGLIGYGPFVNINEDISKEELKESYLKHINKVTEILGIDHIGVSTDDMTFATYLFNEDEGDQVCNHATVKKELVELLEGTYNKEEIEKILFRNIENKLFN